jgi:predicted Rossmann fold flavoprotein
MIGGSRSIIDSNERDGGDRPLKTDEDEVHVPDGRLKRTQQPTEPARQRACEIAIVGAGAAGLATAIFARRLNPNRSVLLLDSATRPGAKILVSGGSRCNVTNVAVSERDFNGGNPAVIRRILKAFPPKDVVGWFASLGVPLHEEAHGKLFPDSNRSRDVLNALLQECRTCGVDLQTGTRVEELTDKESLTLHTTHGRIDAQAVVMATGGLSLPKTGSDGRGLSVAESLGHTIVPTTPALVPLVTMDDQPLHQALTGISHEVELALWLDGSVSRRLRGSLLWTHFGLSGPVVLDMSRHWLRARGEGHDVRLTINLVAGESFDSLEHNWTARTASRPRLSLHGLLADLMPAGVAAAILERLGLVPASQVAKVSRADRRRLLHAVAEWPVNITDSRGYNYAEATAGGVALDEIDPSTMASRRCRGLYLVGEMLDVDGRIGGFNFQWAWSSARVAARALARITNH